MANGRWWAHAGRVNGRPRRRCASRRRFVRIDLRANASGGGAIYANYVLSFFRRGTRGFSSDTIVYGVKLNVNAKQNDSVRARSGRRQPSSSRKQFRTRLCGKFDEIYTRARTDTCYTYFRVARSRTIPTRRTYLSVFRRTRAWDMKLYTVLFSVCTVFPFSLTATYPPRFVRNTTLSTETSLLSVFLFLF